MRNAKPSTRRQSAKAATRLGMAARSTLKQVSTLVPHGMRGMRLAVPVYMNANKKTLRVAGKLSKVAPKNPWSELLDTLEEQHAAYDQEQSAAAPKAKTEGRQLSLVPTSK